MIDWITVRDAEYEQMLKRQTAFFEQLKSQKRAGIPVVDERIYIVEHRPVYTLGTHGAESNIINMPLIQKNGASIFRTNRGGDVTYHGPGQIVLYPIIDLEKRSLGVKAYVTLLEQSVIDTLDEYGIKAGRIDGATGVWIDWNEPFARKICAIGIKCSRFITMHGLALNVNTDLSSFSLINPCGFVDKGVTSMERELGRELDLMDVAEVLRRNLSRLLGE